MAQGSPLQGNKGTAIGATSMTLAFPGAVTGTSLLVATMQTPNTVGGSVSDNVNGSYSTGINHSTTNTADDIAGFFKSGNVSGTPTVTITPGGAGNIGATIEEYAGPYLASPLDQTGATDANGTSITSGSKTNTGANGDLCVSSLSTATKSTTLSNSTSGWTVDQNNTPNATEDAVVGSRIQVPAAAFTTTWSTSGAAMDMSVIVMSFKFAPLGGTVGAPHPRLFRAPPGYLALQLAYLSAQRYQAYAPPPVQAAAAPLLAVGRLIRTVTARRGGASVAGPAPAAAPPILSRERLVPTVATPRGKARAAPPAGPATPPITARERLVRLLPLVRGRAQVAGPGPAAQAPTTARHTLKRVVTGLRGRAAVATAPSRAPVLGRHVLRRVVALVRGGRALAARPGPAAAAPTTARQRLVRSAPALRGRAQVATALVRPPLVARGFVRGVVRVVRGALARLEAFVAVVVATPAKVTGAVSAVNTLVGAATATYTVAGTAAAAYVVAGAASAAYSVSGAVSAPYTVAGAVFPVPT